MESSDGKLGAKVATGGVGTMPMVGETVIYHHNGALVVTGA